MDKGETKLKIERKERERRRKEMRRGRQKDAEIRRGTRGQVLLQRRRRRLNCKGQLG